jgi:type IV secretion system protein VirD4
VNEVKRPLLLPQEIQELDSDKEIITITTHRPILCDKSFYYKDPYFMDKLKSVSPTLRKSKGIPSREKLNQAIQKKETSIKIKRKIS